MTKPPILSKAGALRALFDAVRDYNSDDFEVSLYYSGRGGYLSLGVRPRGVAGESYDLLRGYAERLSIPEIVRSIADIEVAHRHREALAQRMYQVPAERDALRH